MSDMPVPETRSPILVNAAGKATRHTYHHTEEVPFVTVAEDGTRGVDGTGYTHVFECTQTGALRRFGIEDAS